jgi:SAM-dependent methyltransferase
MRVMDVGSGVGDVAFLAADLVGDTGEVLGVDLSGVAVAAATARAEAKSLRNVSFREGDPAAMTFERPSDAVVGRYVLLFQPNPAALLRKLITHVRPGGVVVFHEPCRNGVRSFPPVPSFDRAWDLIDEVVRRSGADPLMGIKLHATFLAAGLPAPSMRMESVIAGGSTSLEQVHFEMDLAVTLAPEMERLGVASAEDVGAETLADRVFDEAIASESVIVGRSEIGAWARV